MSRVGSAWAVSEVVDQRPDLLGDVVKGPSGVVTTAGAPYSGVSATRVPGAALLT